MGANRSAAWVLAAFIGATAVGTAPALSQEAASGGHAADRVLHALQAPLPNGAKVTFADHSYDAASRTLTLQGVVFTSPTSPAISVFRVDFADISGGVGGKPLTIGQATFHGVALETRPSTSPTPGLAHTQARLRIGEIVIKDMNFASLGGTGLSGAAAPSFAPYAELSIRKVSLASPVFVLTADAIDVTGIGRDSRQVTVAHWTLTGGHFDFPKTSPAAMSVLRLGYDRIRYSMSGSWRFDPTAQEARTRMSIVFDGMGTVNLDADLVDVPKPGSPEAKLPPAMLATLYKVKAFEIAYEDHSLVPHVLASVAKAGNKTPEAVVDETCARLKAREAANPGSTVATDALIAFLQAPGRLSLSIHPTTPLPMLAVYIGIARSIVQPSDPTARALDFKIEASPPAR